jgi:uncharacterized membrane protein
MPIDPSVQPGETPDPILPSSLPPAATPPLTSSSSVPATETVGSTSTGLEPNVAAGLSTLVTVITGIIFLLLEKRDAYVRFWAMQSVVFGIAWFAVTLVFTVIHAILHAIFWPLGLLWGLFSAVVYLGFVIVWIVMIIQAFSGKQWSIPYLGRIAREQLAKYPNLGA